MPVEPGVGWGRYVTLLSGCSQPDPRGRHPRLGCGPEMTGRAEAQVMVADAPGSRVWGLIAERAGDREAPVSAGDACAVAAAVAGVDGAWLTVMSDPARRVLAHATGAKAAELEELQFALGEGPCVDAFTVGSPMLAPDLEAPG